MKPRPKIRLSRLRDIGWTLWDPIGLMPSHLKWDDEGNLSFADEYDSYLIYVAGQIRRGVIDSEVTNYLIKIETEHMGLPDGGIRTRKRAESVVAAIRADKMVWSDSR